MDTHIEENPLSENEFYACNNCATEIIGPYCWKCGQEHLDDTSSLRGLIGAFLTRRKKDISIYLFTVRELLLRPGTVLSEFLSGMRKKYYHPVNFLILSAGLVTFLMFKFGGYDGEASVENLEQLGIEMDQKTKNAQAQWSEFVGKNMKYVVLLNFPLYALGSFWFFKKKGYKYGDHLLMMAYLSGIHILFMCLYVPFTVQGDMFDIWTVVSLVFLFGYFGWAFKDFFKISYVKGFFSAMGVYLLPQLVFTLVAGVIGIVIGIVWALMGKFG